MSGGLINNSTPIGRTDGGQNLQSNLSVKAMLGRDAPTPSRSAKIFKDMMEKARPSTPLGGSY